MKKLYELSEKSENLIEYDTHKNAINIRKHKISIPELATIFSNPFAPPAMDIPDVKNSQREKRFWAFGCTTTGWKVKIWYTYRGNRIRFIGGRKLK